MSFISKLWKDRVSDYPNKRKLTKEDGTSETVTVERAEGDIVVAGDAFNAENMNDLETRIQNGFNAVEQAQAELNEKLQNISFGFSTNSIKTISSRTETYTVDRNCWCVGRIKGGSADPCGIILDDVLLFNLDATSYVPVVIPIKKGQKISIKGNATLCSLNFYESL